MIKFIVRFIIFLFAISASIGFASGLGINSFLIAGIFVCVWIIIVPLKELSMWLLFFAFLFGVLHYDYWGVYVIGFMCIAIIFDVIHSQIKRTANTSVIVLYGVSFLLTILVESLMEFFIYNTITISVYPIFVDIIGAGILFFIFRFVITKAERFIDLYTHGDDMHCHT